MAQDTLLRSRRVCVLSRTAKLLEDVSFEIGEGERAALTGGPLAGKSLILQLAIGIARPSSGCIDGCATRRSCDCGVVLDAVSRVVALQDGHIVRDGVFQAEAELGQRDTGADDADIAAGAANFTAAPAAARSRPLPH
jgi:energy-coupling factor transporter ATP-binding protein EcfA2